MSYWSGYSTKYARDKITGCDSVAQIKAMQRELLIAGAKSAKVWKRIWSGVKCSCVMSERPVRPHMVCYGTGIVVGFRQLGYEDIVVWRDFDSSVVSGVVNNSVLNVSVVDLGGGNVQVVTDWISGSDWSGELQWFRNKNWGSVEVSIDDMNWFNVNELVLPVDKFKIRISGNVDFGFFRAKVRKRGENELWLISEQPVRRLEELLRWARAEVTGDVSAWCLADEPELWTGDLLEWTEGRFVSKRFKVVDRVMTQFKVDDNSSEPITQRITLKYVTPGSQESLIV